MLSPHPNKICLICLSPASAFSDLEKDSAQQINIWQEMQSDWTGQVNYDINNNNIWDFTYDNIGCSEAVKKYINRIIGHWSGLLVNKLLVTCLLLCWFKLVTLLSKSLSNSLNMYMAHKCENLDQNRYKGHRTYYWIVTTILLWLEVNHCKLPSPTPQNKIRASCLNYWVHI